MGKIVYEGNVIAVATMDNYGGAYSFEADVLDYMLQTGVSYEMAVKNKYGIVAMDILDAVYVALNLSDSWIGETKNNYNYGDYSINVTCHELGLSEFEYTALYPNRSVLHDSLYDRLEKECGENDSRWVVLFVEPDIEDEDPLRMKCYKDCEVAINEAEAFAQGWYFRKAFVYSNEEDKIVTMYHWIRKDDAYIKNLRKELEWIERNGCHGCGNFKKKHDYKMLYNCKIRISAND